MDTLHIEDPSNGNKVEVVRVVIQSKDVTVQDATDQTINCIEIQSI